MARILVVNRKKDYNYIFHSLKEWGYEVSVVQNPTECRQVLRTTEVDIVFINIEDDEGLPLNFRAIKEAHVHLPVIGLTALAESELNSFLDTSNINRSDFIKIFYQPLKLEEIVFAIEAIMTSDHEEPIKDEKPLTPKERQQRLTARRRPLEDQRLSGFLSAHTERETF